MNRAIIFLNGDPPSERFLRSLDLSGALIVAADGAYRYIKGIIRPHVLLGDFDSLSPGEVEPGTETVRFPADKDYTDGHLAAEYALSRGIMRADFFGAFGGRADMEYANLSLLYQFASAGGRARLVSERETVTLEKGEFSLPAAVGARVSLAPFFATAHILQSKGLKYPLRGITLGRLHALGVSNRAIEETISAVSEDEVLVFIENTTDRGVT